MCGPAVRNKTELIEWIDLRFEYKGAKMGSLDRTARMNQKSEAEKRVEARVAKLKEMGLDDKKMARDPLLRQAKAALNKSNARLRAIDAKDALTQELAAKKAQPNTKTKGKASAKDAKGKKKPKSKEKKVKAKKA